MCGCRSVPTDVLVLIIIIIYKVRLFIYYLFTYIIYVVDI